MTSLTLFAASSVIAGPFGLTPTQGEASPKTYRACMHELEALDFFKEAWVARFTNPDGTLKPGYWSKKVTTTLSPAGQSGIVLTESMLSNDKPFKKWTFRFDLNSLNLSDLTVRHELTEPLPAGWSISSGLKVQEFWRVNMHTVNSSPLIQFETVDESNGPSKASTTLTNSDLIDFRSEQSAHDFVRLLRAAKALAPTADTQTNINPSAPSSPPVVAESPSSTNGAASQANPLPAQANAAPGSLSASIQQMEALDWWRHTYSMIKSPNLTRSSGNTWGIAPSGSEGIEITCGINSMNSGGSWETVSHSWRVAVRDLDPEDITIEHQTLADPQTDGWKLTSGTFVSEDWVLTIRSRSGKGDVEHTVGKFVGGKMSAPTTERIDKVSIPFEKESSAQDFKRLVQSAIAFAK